jgi:hypothetical protein
MYRLETPHNGKSLAVWIVPGTMGSDQEAARGLMTTTTHSSSLRSTIRRSNTSTVAKLLPCYYLPICMSMYKDA